MGVVTGALTTSVAFMTLTLTSFQAFQEWGIVAGGGILACLLASLFFLPAVLVLQEKVRLKFKKTEKLKEVNMEFRFLRELGQGITLHPWLSLSLLILLTLFLITQIPRVHMNNNYMNLEAKGLESIRLQNEIARRFNMSADNLMLVANSLEEADRYTEMLNSRPTVGMVESIAEYLPPLNKQKQRRPWVEKIARAQQQLPPLKAIQLQELKTELNRFQDNIDEMSQLAFMGGLDRVVAKCDQFLGLNEAGKQVSVNPIQQLIQKLESTPQNLTKLTGYQRLFRHLMKNRLSRMANPAPITMSMIPENVKDRFVSRDGTHFLILIYTNRNLWEGLVTTNYLDNVIRGIPGITGTPVFMKALVREAARQGKMAFLFAFLAIVVLLLLDFKKVSTTFLAMTPLLVSAIWLLGTMGLFHIPLTIINVMGFPLILGIGIDDGVHIIHRYQIEGKGSLPYVLSSIGKAIFLTSLTTLLGFGSLIFSRYRGYVSLGEVLSIGIGFCFILSVTLLPTLLKLIHERKA
jgi:predicted RND superfamily exporter protein